jgi:15-cis-phytoene synthase
VNAAKITRESKSNLALAFVALGRERRNDITIFYAFCRVIDDIADSPEGSMEAKASQLRDWRRWIRESAPDEPALARDLRGLYAKYAITPTMLDEIIDGVEMDLRNVRYETFEELRVYCYRVASAVGLVSIEIFGYRNAACRDYAIALGLALQVTNIIRDVGKDLNNGRVYLPQEDLARFGYSEADLRARKYNEAWRSMVAAEIMASVYHALLRRMKADRFRVFDKEYRLSKIEKSTRVAGQLLRLCLNARR